MTTRSRRHVTSAIATAASLHRYAPTRRQVLEASKAREQAALDELHKVPHSHKFFRQSTEYQLAIAWREKRIQNLDWHLSQLPADDHT